MPVSYVLHWHKIRRALHVCPITALIWALEIGDVSPFRTIEHAISFAASAEMNEIQADEVMRMPLSKLA